MPAPDLPYWVQLLADDCPRDDYDQFLKRLDGGDMANQFADKQVYVLHGKEQADRARLAISGAIGMPVLYECIIQPHKKNRTMAQNALLWLWHTEYCEHFGIDGEETGRKRPAKLIQHENFKLECVLPILLRDAPDVGLIELYGLCASNIEALVALVEVLSTTHLTTAQFSEALNEYERQTFAAGLSFSHPEDVYYSAIANFQ